MNKLSLLSRFLPLILLAVFAVCTPVRAESGAAGAGNELTEMFKDPGVDQEAGTSLSKGLVTITKYIYWIFYLLGAIFMGVGAFKLKQGDIAGFSKNFAGGATLFFVPAIIKVLAGIGNKASTGG